MPTFTPDPTSPDWGTLTADDGSTSTVPTSQAQQQGAAIVPATPAGQPEQPPPPIAPVQQMPVGQPAQGQFYGAPEPQAPAPPVQPPPDTVADPMTGQAMGTAPGAMPAGAQPMPIQGQPGRGPALAPPPGPNPNGQLLAPGQPGALGVAEVQDYKSPLSPEQQIGNVNSAAADYTDAATKSANAAQQGAIQGNNTALASVQAQQRANDEAQQRIRLENEEHQKVVKALTDHPIDEGEFWTAGRTISAGIALALSGFTHGASGGRDQTAGLVSKMIDDQVSRWMRSQQENRHSVLEFRRQAIGDNKTAMATLKMQAYGLIQQKVQYEATKAGLDIMPPAGDLVAQQANMKRMEQINTIGAQRNQVVTEKMSKPTGPVTAADQKLVQMGLGASPADARKQYNAAMGAGAQQGNLGAKVSAATRLSAAAELLDKLAKENGGTLPNQQLWNPKNIEFFRTSLAKAGDASATSAIQAQQALEQAMLELRRSLPSSKLADSNAEGAQLRLTLDSGETQTTLAGVRAAAQTAAQSLQDTASRYAPGHGQDLIDFVNQERAGTQGVRPSAPGFTPGRTRAAGVSPTGEDLVRAGGGQAPGPLAQSPSASAPGSPTAPNPNPSSSQDNQMRLQTLQTLNNEAGKAGLNGDAITRIVRFESGGKADAHNPSGATGIIQWMPDVFKGMTKPSGYENVRHEDLKDLTAEEQVPLALQYFKDKFAAAGVDPKKLDVGDYYLAVAAPSAIGKPDSTVVYKQGSPAWTQNAAWRPAGGGDITAGSIRAKARTF